MLGVRRSLVGHPATARPLLITANHSSWLDIVVLGAALPVCFVAKSEVGAWPGVGFLARLSRTIFVDRARRTATRHTTEEMGAAMARGEAVVLFAEGTSSDHNRVLPFRSALIGAARQAGAGSDIVWVQPVAIAYPARGGLPLLRRERPSVAWYGGMTLPGHLWAMLMRGGPEAVISFGAPIPVDATTDRKQVALNAEAEVRAMTRAAQRGWRRGAATGTLLLGAQTG